MSTNAADALADKQLQYAKLNSQLLAEQQYWMKSEAHKKSVRWKWLMIALVFFVFSKFVMLRTEYKQVFAVFAKRSSAQYACLFNNATPWNIVLNVAYPWLGRLINENPLTQDQARFLVFSIRNSLFPTADWIQNNCPASCEGLNLTPLHYVCGNIIGDWASYLKQIGKERSIQDLTAQVKSDPASTPWASILKTTSKLLDGSVDSELMLGVLLSQGFWGVATMKGNTASPEQIYLTIFNQQPEQPKCNNVTAFAGVATNAATFSMAGSAFGPEGTAAGATAGALFGAALGLLTPSAGCDKSPLQTIIPGAPACVVM